MPVAKRPGYYVEGRFFRDNYHQALARANHLAKEYGRAIRVMYLAPEDCGNMNNAVPFAITTVGEDPDPDPEPALQFHKSDFMRSLSDAYQHVANQCPSMDEIDVRGWMIPFPEGVGKSAPIEPTDQVDLRGFINPENGKLMGLHPTLQEWIDWATGKGDENV